MQSSLQYDSARTVRERVGGSRGDAAERRSYRQAVPVRKTGKTSVTSSAEKFQKRRSDQKKFRERWRDREGINTASSDDRISCDRNFPSVRTYNNLCE